MEKLGKSLRLTIYTGWVGTFFLLLRHFDSKKNDTRTALIDSQRPSLWIWIQIHVCSLDTSLSIWEVKCCGVTGVVTEIDPKRDSAFPVGSVEVIHTHIWLNRYSYKLYLGWYFTLGEYFLYSGRKEKINREYMA